jgi:hypothetical protein
MQGFAALVVGLNAYVVFLVLCAPDVQAILSA